MSAERTVTVPLERLARWLSGFTERNGPITDRAVSGGSLTLATARGGRAALSVGERAAGLLGTTPDPEQIAVAAAAAHRSVAVVLIRRGGWAVARGTLSGTAYELTATKHGQRYVQGRTAAGGQSQQRFARRRAGQAHALVGAARDGAIAVLGHEPGPVDLLITGGDRALLDELLGQRPLSRLAAAEQRYVDVPDPRRRTLDDAVTMGRSVTIVVRNAEEDHAG